jgi:hypothetical protein
MPTLMRRLAFVVVVNLLVLSTACVDRITFGLGGDFCAYDPPRLGGQWRGLLRGQELSVRFTERCERSRGLYAQWVWVVRGDWYWYGLGGSAGSEVHSPAGGTTIVLAIGSVEESPDRATITLVDALPAHSSVKGTLSGNLPTITDTAGTRIRFNGEAVTLVRR